MIGATDPLNRLLALEEIGRLKISYFRLVDEKRWPEVRELFAEEARIDAVTGDPGGPDEFVSSLTRLAPPEVRTVHMPGPPELELTAPDRGTGNWLMWFWSESLADDGTPEVVEGLRRYEDEYQRDDGGAWRIASMLIQQAPPPRP